MARKRLGELLLEAGLVDETGLRSALNEQRRTGGPLGRVLVDLKLVTEEELVAALSRQLAVPLVDLDALEIPQDVLDIIPADQADHQGIIPFAQPMKFLDIATSDPTNLSLIDEIRVKTNLNVRTYLAGPRAIERALLRFYGRGLGPRGVVGRRQRDSVAFDAEPARDDEMEMVGQFDTEAAPAAGPRPSRTTTGSLSQVLRVPPPPPARPAPTTSPPPATGAGRGPTFADLAALQERINSLEALVRRDEEVLKKLLGLIIEKGVATRDEVIARLK